MARHSFKFAAAAVLLTAVAGGVYYNWATINKYQSAVGSPPQAVAQPVKPPPDPISIELAHMTLAQKVGQLFMLGFKGTLPDKSISYELKAHNFGGVILYKFNVQNPVQLPNLTSKLSSLPQTQPFIAIDEEGGLVTRISWDPTADISERSITKANAFSTAKTRGQFLKQLGINLNLAPVVDVTTSPAAALYPRTFNSDWGVLAQEMLNGYGSAGILASLKHFPSYGNFVGDADAGLRYKTLSATEKQAFSTALKSAKILMVSPVIAQNIDPQMPAVESKLVMRYIRNNLGFRGLIMTDDMEMPAIAKNFNSVAFAQKAFDAGADMLLFSKNYMDANTVYRAIIARATVSKTELKRVNDSVYRILTAKSYL